MAKLKARPAVSKSNCSMSCLAFWYEEKIERKLNVIFVSAPLHSEI